MEEKRVLDLVKYKWKNVDGVWIRPDWLIVSESDSNFDILSRIRIIRPSAQAVDVIDRVGIPENLRQTGRLWSMLNRILKKNGRNLDASTVLMEMISIERESWQGEQQQ